MYRVVLLSITGTRLSTFANARVKGWSHRINAPGRFQFSLPFGDTQATPTNLQKYKRVQLERKIGKVYVPIWYGFIESHKRQGIEIDVNCASMLELFRHRFTDKNEVFSGAGSTEAFGLLSDANTDNATGITAGSGGVATTKDVKASGRIDLLRAWELLAQAHDAEFEISVSGVFDFVPLLGIDQSHIITLKFFRNGKPGSNIEDTEEGEDGKPMANRIYAETTGGLGFSYIWNGSTQGTYGVLAEAKQFNEAQDLATLTSMATTDGTQRENPIPDYAIKPIMESQSFDVVNGNLQETGLSYDTIGIGDLIRVKIGDEGSAIDEVKRVAEIVVNVGEGLLEELSYTLSEPGVFVTAGYLDADEVSSLKRRVRELEALI